MDKLREEYIDILERRGWDVCCYTDGGRVECEWFSPAGEDFLICETVNDFPSAVYQRYFDFDVEEHVRMFLNAKEHGMKGVPGVVVLVHDAEAIENELKELAEELLEIERRSVA